MKKLNILLVDDDFINLKLLETMLKKSGLSERIVEAKDGAEALEKLKNEDIDIVLLDIIMPVMNGIEMLKVMKSDERLKDIPVLVLSTDETKKNEALDSGAIDFINKPIREQTLNEKIKKYTCV